MSARRRQLRSRARRHAPPERGAILILSALILILLLAISAFATDLGAWYRQGQEQQRAVDVSSLNASQSYDIEVKTYLNAHGADTLGDLTAAQRLQVEQQAFDAGVNSIVGVLGSSGIVVTSVPTPTYDPNPPNGSSTVTLVATDGTTIDVTRNGHGEFTITVSQVGTQYFSNILRDAPTIDRTATSVISNCNADCSRDIEIRPPFTGFSATGSGDGYRPLLWQDDEIWTVNHHSNGRNNDNASSNPDWGGDIVCMDRNTTAPCAGAHYSLHPYQTASWSLEHLTSGGKLYFLAREPTSKEVGLVCFDILSSPPDFCASNEFTYLWDKNTPQRFTNWINGVGPWAYGGKLYSLSVDGRLHCVQEGSMTPCASYPLMTSVGNHSAFPPNYLQQGVSKIQGEVIGSQLFFSVAQGGAFFGCFDLATNADCAGWSTAGYVANLNGGAAVMTFMSYTTGGAHSGICALTQDTGAATRTACYSKAGAGPTGLPNSSGILGDLIGKNGQTWAGSTFSWNNERTYFGSGATDKTGCYDWTIPGTCAEGSIDHIAVHGMKVEPYHYAQVTPECIIGLGDESQFFSFNPVTMLTCTESSVTTEIYPCDCGDGVTKRWGTLELPPEMLAVLVPPADAVVSAPANPDITGDLFAGPLDLSPLNGYDGPATLTITVQSKTNADGTLQWTQPYSAELSLVVQPTLSN